jgi:hypothetical protein
MKRITYVALKGLLVAGLVVPLAAAQSQSNDLGQYAREHKKEKDTTPPTKRVYDNDNLPHDEHLSVVGPAEPAGTDQSAKGTEEASSQAGANPDQAKEAPGGAKTTTAPGESPDQRQQVYGDWQKKIGDQKQALDLLQRELDVLQREYRMRAAAVYADVGYRLRNSAQWDKEDAQYKEKIAAKQKAVDAGKQQLADLQEQARKSGVPSKLRE